MKRENILFRILFLFTIFTFGWVTTGCREDVAGASGITRRVRLSVNVTDDGGNLTRATLTEEEGRLKSDWTSGDKLIVANSKGEKLGELTLKSPANKETDSEGGTVYRFEGDITTEDSGTATYSFFHIANKDIANLTNDKGVVTIDYSNQDGSIEWIRSHDIFSGQAKVVFTTAPSTDDESGESTESAQSETVKLSRPIAFGHFTLSFPEGVTVANDVVKITGKGIYTTLNVSLGENKYLVGNGESGESGAESSVESGIITTKGSNLYLAILVPDGGEIEPVFTATIDGVEYTGTLGAHPWEAGTFVREGHEKGVSVKMEAESDEEDPDNPLTKFAKTNLIRLSARGDSNIENGFADDETHPGALFQWGRNYGFMPMHSDDVTDFNLPKDFVTSADGQYPYSHWLDAFGKVTLKEDGIEPNHPEYYLYEQSQTPTNTYVSGSGMHNTVYGLINDAPIAFGNMLSKIISKNPTKYFMWSEDSGTLQDYWVQSVEGTDNDTGWTWDERAGYGAYEPFNDYIKDNVAWRLPTKDEFKAILPEFDYEHNGNLSDYLNKVEVRVYNEVRYAIIWNLTNNGLEIKARVVDSDFSDTQADDAFWAGKQVVTRFFPFTGQIVPGRGTVLTTTSVPFGLPYYIYTGINAGAKYEGGTIYSINVHPSVDNPSRYVGAYWTGDGKGAFRFSTSASPYGDQIKLSDDHPVNAYAIRPVRDTATE